MPRMARESIALTGMSNAVRMRFSQREPIHRQGSRMGTIGNCRSINERDETTGRQLGAHTLLGASTVKSIETNNTSATKRTNKAEAKRALQQKVASNEIAVM